jgi:hypothetical protein
VMERLEGSRLLKHPYYRQTQRLKSMGSTEHGPKRLPSRGSASSPAIFLFRRFAGRQRSTVSTLFEDEDDASYSTTQAVSWPLV